MEVVGTYEILVNKLCCILYINTTSNIVLIFNGFLKT